MKKLSLKLLALVIMAAISVFAITSTSETAHAEDYTKNTATSISISPVSNILQLSSNSVYDNIFKVTNNGDDVMEFEVYALPYSYTYSEEEDAYKLGFSRENAYTQITRWITFKDADGNYVENATFTAEPGTAVEVSYRITTPESIPAGGQYAVLFAHTLTSSVNASGIRTEASPGLVLYGRGEGETIVTSEISGLKISQTKEVGGDKKNLINATAKVKNTGNVDFMATGVLKVDSVFGQAHYETKTETSRARISVIPESELEISDTWDETPYFVLFKVYWTVSAAGSSETIERLILILPMPILVTIILLLTIIIVWIIIEVRKRKERRSKFKL